MRSNQDAMVRGSGWGFSPLLARAELMQPGRRHFNPYPALARGLLYPGCGDLRSRVYHDGSRTTYCHSYATSTDGDAYTRADQHAGGQRYICIPNDQRQRGHQLPARPQHSLRPAGGNPDARAEIRGEGAQ